MEIVRSPRRFCKNKICRRDSRVGLWLSLRRFCVPGLKQCLYDANIFGNMYNQELGVAYYRVAVVKSAVKQDYLVCVEFVVVALDSNFEGASQDVADFVAVAVFVQLHRINDIGGFCSGAEYFTLVELTN